MSTGSDGRGVRAALDEVEDWYHVPALAAIAAVMLWIRLRSYDDFVVDGEVLFRGNDPWWHYRETMWTIQHYPFTMPFDPWTNFPFGKQVGQFGTLFDQITATVALIVGLGSPGEDLAMRVMLVMAPLFAVATLVPAYLLARRVASRFASVAAMAVLALLPGTFLRYTVVGFYDHHAAEVFFQTAGVLAVVVAVDVARRHQPVWELVVDRDVDALRTPGAYAAAAGVVAGLYMWAWPPGVLLIGILGGFLLVHHAAATYNDRTPEPVAFVGVVAATVAGLLALVQIEEFGFTVTTLSFVHVVLPLGVAGGTALLAWLTRLWERRDIDRALYPVATGAIVAVGLGLTAVVLPSLFNLLVDNVSRIVGFGTSATAQTVGEARPFLDRGPAVEVIVDEYGFAFFVAVLGALWLIAAPLVRDADRTSLGLLLGGLAAVGVALAFPAAFDAVGGAVGVTAVTLRLAVAVTALVAALVYVDLPADRLFLVVWGTFVTLAAFTQLRFNYYLAVAVAVFAAYFLSEVLAALDLRRPAGEALGEVKGWQLMIAGAALLVLFAPLFVAVSTPAYATANATGPGAVAEWDDSLAWLSEETPAPGELGGGGDRMAYYGTYDRPESGDYAYPDGAYGVQSWWDYGHWITTRGERIPNANPFQDGAGAAANYLLATTEADAAAVLDRRGEEAQRTRYVMVDWEMATPGAKFSAPVVFYDDADVSQEDFTFTMWQSTGEGGARPAFVAREQRYYESLMVRLYGFHGSAVDPTPVVLDWEEQTYRTREGEEITVRQAPTGQNDRVVKLFDNMTAAEAYVEEDGSAQIGGVGRFPEERVEALEHHRLVHVSEASARRPDTRFFIQEFRTVQATGIRQGELTRTEPRWVKTFERVPGATVEGSGARPGTEVVATVEMRTATNDTFTYVQYAEVDENGRFEMTLPYSTTGYDEFGPENGYTNVSVRATGPYTIGGQAYATQDGIFQNTTTVEVHEAQVLGVDEGPIEAELEPESALPEEQAGGSGSGDGSTDGDAGTAAVRPVTPGGRVAPTGTAGAG